MGREVYEAIPTNVFEYTPQIVLGEEGVLPELIVPLLAIQGDPGDGIPGCKGVKAAAIPLLNEYGSIEEIYAAIEECQEDAKKEKELVAFWKEIGVKVSPLKKLKAGKEEVLLSQQLAQMKRDIALPYEIDDFAFKIDKEELEKILIEYEMNSIQKEIAKLKQGIFCNRLPFLKQNEKVSLVNCFLVKKPIFNRKNDKKITHFILNLYTLDINFFLLK